MKYFVNENCIGCGLCTVVCPEVFALTEDNVAQAIEEDVPSGTENDARDAKKSCPVSAIEGVE